MTTAIVEESIRQTDENVETCNYCRKSIVWGWTRPKRGKPTLMPVNYAASNNGNVALVWDAEADRLKAEVLGTPAKRAAWAEQGWPLHEHHKLSCPHHGSWSKGRRR